jgi:ferric-dicitrate binding protein FerR (iron transport regulator)
VSGRIRRLAAALSVACLASAAAAADLPDGQAAVAEKALGPVQCVLGHGRLRPVKDGRVFFFGDRVVTGEGGRVLLRLPNGAVLRLAPNSDLAFRDPVGASTYLGLLKGWARCLVGRRPEGAEFEVQTDNAVAAVKGTDMEVGKRADGSTYACVYASDHKPALELRDLSGSAKVGVGAGEGATDQGGVISTFQLSNADRKKDAARFQGLPEPSL